MNHQLIKENLEKIKNTFLADKYKVDYSKDAITIGQGIKLSESEIKILKEALLSMICWRKGPYQLFDLFLDSEWKDYLKWNLIKPYLKNIGKKVVADIGCNNGYFMFKMMEFDPQEIIGFDPYKIYHYQFDFLQHFIKESKIKMLESGVEDLVTYPKYFDFILYMGVLYHRRKPLESLIHVFNSLKSGGQAIIETMILDGDDIAPVEIKDRYSKMKNVYLLTTQNGFINWLEQAGFVNIKIIGITKTSIEEQRSTEFSPFDSLESFLDPNDDTRTIEGYNRPTRIAAICQRS